ncbi:40S ribosomal protein S19-3 [Anaeramoeba flamelloides]|uniref:40S ribosomal protein S19-3 n=1 Tax=Anaeramoeba flamelloides TaxID=1746091 RepID=A0AAV7Z3F2_9EUKA|nr:40S ribosomal protein S19-3 [Anaeramoeba flamelloides]
MISVLSNRSKNKSESLLVDPYRFISNYANHLKKGGKIKVPHWSLSEELNSGHSNNDWFYIRAASLLHDQFLLSRSRVYRFNGMYSTKTNQRSFHKKFSRSGGRINRTIMDQFEKAGVLKTTKCGLRKVTSFGRKEMEMFLSKSQSQSQLSSKIKKQNQNQNQKVIGENTQKKEKEIEKKTEIENEQKTFPNDNQNKKQIEIENENSGNENNN